MLFETRIQIVGKDGNGQNLDLSLLVYDAKDRQWRSLTTLLGSTDAELRRSRRSGMHIFKADLKTLDKIFAFESLPYIRVTKARNEKDDELPHFIDVVANIRQDNKGITLDFGAALFLGTEHGFITGTEDQPYFCQGVSAPLDKSRLTALAAIYFNPGAISDLELSLGKCREQHQSVQSELKDKNSLIALMQNREEEIVAKLKAANVKITTQVQSIETLEKSQSTLQKKLSDCKENSKEKDKTIRKLNVDQDTLQGEYNKAQDTIITLQTQLDEAETRQTNLSEALTNSEETSEKLNAELQRLKEKYAECEATLASAQADLQEAVEKNASLVKQLQLNAEEIEALNTKLEMAGTEIVTLREDYDRLTTALQTCGKEKIALTTALNLAKDAQLTANADFVRVSDELALCKEQRELCEQKLAKAESRSDALSDQVKELEAVTTQLSEAITSQNQSEERWQEKTKELRVALATQTAKAQVKETQLGQVRDQIKKAVKTEDVIASIGLDASRAAQSLRDKGLPYKLGRLHLNMKTVMMPDGKSLYLPDAGMSASDTALTEIDIELLPDEDAFITQSDELACPNLLGLTQTAVITNLMALGLKHQSSIAAVNKENEHGRAIRQIPEAGQPIVPGTFIRVIYGQHSEKGIL